MKKNHASGRLRPWSYSRCISWPKKCRSIFYTLSRSQMIGVMMMKDGVCVCVCECMTCACAGLSSEPSWWRREMVGSIYLHTKSGMDTCSLSELGVTFVLFSWESIDPPVLFCSSGLFTFFDQNNKFKGAYTQPSNHHQESAIYDMNAISKKVIYEFPKPRPW